jgi:hypothetical protein
MRSTCSVASYVFVQLPWILVTPVHSHQDAMRDAMFATFSKIILVRPYLLVLKQYLSYHDHGLTTTSIYLYILPYNRYQAPSFYPDP